MSDLQTLRLVLFRVAELTCALPVEGVREIIPAQPATRIPGAPVTIDGLVNVRGALLTVADGHRVLGRDGAADPEGSILVVALEGRAMGLVVDEVLDLLELPAEHLEPRESVPGLDPRLARAVGRHGERVFIVLDSTALLAPLLA